MGEKGDKLTKDSELMATQLCEKLKSIDGITSKKMFGGHGIFHKGKMFGIVDSKAQVYFKSNKTNQRDFEARGSQRHGKMPYFSIPKEILIDIDELLAWANKALQNKI